MDASAEKMVGNTRDHWSDDMGKIARVQSRRAAKRGERQIFRRETREFLSR